MNLPTTHRSARDTLMELLDEGNRLRLNTGQALIITGSKGTQFLVYYGYSGIVREVLIKGDYQRTHGWCAYPYWPRYEDFVDSVGASHISMLAQILLIQTDEDAFRDVAED